MKKNPVMLMILDGFGISDKVYGNAVHEANKKNYNYYNSHYPHTTLKASGLDVGLPEGQMGNSEVGHLNIGAGRIVYQNLTAINKDISDESFFNNDALNNAINLAIVGNKTIHLLGLLSDGGVHSHINHTKAILKLCKIKGMSNVFLHCILDGRDVSPVSALGYIEEIEEYMKEIGIGIISTISGRYYTMDRDKRWDRIEKAYDAMVLLKGEEASTAKSAVEKAYAIGNSDEFILPTVIRHSYADESGKIKDGDTVIFSNFRPDRAREITRAINDYKFDGFPREHLTLNFICMTEYDKSIENVKVAYPPAEYINTLGEYVSSMGFKQLRIAETEKYAHVTFFFNGGVEAPNKNEDRILVPSPRVATYDLKPEMSSYEITEKLLCVLEEDIYDMIILNYANPDMVGHTGNMKATIKAIEAVDKCLGRVVETVLNKEGTVFITADHGNSEQMFEYETGKPMTAHTTNKVPLIWISKSADQDDLKPHGILADIAPTILKAMEVQQPKEMTGKSLIR